MKLKNDEETSDEAMLQMDVEQIPVVPTILTEAGMNESCGTLHFWSPFSAYSDNRLACRYKKKVSGSSFIKLLSRETCLANFFAKQKTNLGTSHNNVKLHGILAGYLFLLSNIFLCLASFCAYRLHEIGP